MYLGGGDPAVILEKYKDRLMMADYKDAKRAGLTAKYITNTYDLSDGEIDSFASKAGLYVDLDIARNGPLVSY